MASSKTYKVVIAETAPIILKGMANCLRSISDFPIGIIEVNSKESLEETISSESIDLLFVNPTFGGILHPMDIRKCSLNEGIKIFAIEISKLSKLMLSLYDDNIHVTDDIEEITKRIKSALKVDTKANEERENLSSREKEIISYVVKGYTNQEIADKLFLSIHTVMTHRRNIARKLQIHSATGLTIYAIVNKIVDLSDIKLM